MRNRVFLLCLIIAVNINSVWNCVLCEMWTMVCKETMAIRAGISSGGHTVKPLILAAFNFGSLVYEIILAPLILAFWGLLAEWSNTLKIARVFKYLRPVIFAKLPWLRNSQNIGNTKNASFTVVSSYVYHKVQSRDSHVVTSPFSELHITGHMTCLCLATCHVLDYVFKMLLRISRNWMLNSSSAEASLPVYE